MTKFFEFEKLVQSTTLRDDIVASGLDSVLEYVQRLPTPADVRIAMDDAITPAQEATLSGVVAAYVFNVPSGTASQLGSTVSAINDVSGAVTLVSENDGLDIQVTTELVNVRGFTTPVIEFVSLFDNVSGLLINEITGTLGSGVVNQLNGISGLVDIKEADGSVSVTPSGSNVCLQINPEILEGILDLSGIAQTQLFEEAPFQSTTSLVFVDAAQLAFPLQASGLWRIFYSMQASVSQANKLAEFRVIAGKDTPEEDIIMDVTTSFNVGAGALPFAGAAYTNLPKFGNEGSGVITVDFRFADTGGGAAQLERILLEATRLGDPSGV